ncbi:hypothetical protein ABID58_001952 [Bradyrhizobium sp. S3.2.6]|uniref:hypothetical protein n=1 Tax=Bradyrhizobium sp. S3.2.6 TaxID=3156428 RepID=UPI0033996D70
MTAYVDNDALLRQPASSAGSSPLFQEMVKRSAVDPISPASHQFRARADQRKRAVLLVEPFHGRVVKMRKLELDDIAIPCLGVLE